MTESPYYRFWFIFGVSPDKTLVDISDGDEDVLEAVPVALADQILLARNRLVERRHHERFLKEVAANLPHEDVLHEPGECVTCDQLFRRSP